MTRPRAVLLALWGIAVAGTAICGFIGIRAQTIEISQGPLVDREPGARDASLAPNTHARYNLPEILLLTAELFTSPSLALRDEYPQIAVPMTLHIARIAAPLLAAVVLFQAAALIFRQQLDALRVSRFARDHIVVCGLGEKGLALALDVSRNPVEARRVVAIERDPLNPAISTCRARGVVVLVRDATQADSLRAARAHYARHLVAMCGDAANANIAVLAEQLANTRRQGILHCHAHVGEVDICRRLRTTELAGRNVDRFVLELFNLYETGARLMLDTPTPFTDLLGDPSPPPQIVVIGLGRFGESLLLHAAQTWWAQHHASGAEKPFNPMRVTLVDASPEDVLNRRIQELMLRHPIAGKACHIVPESVDVTSYAFQESDFIISAHRAARIARVFVCLGREELSFSAAWAMAQRMRKAGVSAPIVPRMTRLDGLGSLLKLPGPEALQKNLHPFPLIERACSKDLLELGDSEQLARTIHEDYVRRRLEEFAAAGAAPDAAQQVTLAPWRALPEVFKNSNRRCAAHLILGLNELGYRITPLRDPDRYLRRLPVEHVELLGRREHERWMQNMAEEGYRYGTQKLHNSHARSHPDMLPWDRIPESTREKDRQLVAGTPDNLARVGYEIVRS